MRRCIRKQLADERIDRFDLSESDGRVGTVLEALVEPLEKSPEACEGPGPPLELPPQTGDR